ncbi:hypothetical protein [Paenibacillus pinihumi]|uniref:hypothetical protein n=1 Tax=Paenibacillus pinihumi TaxID=669462 RepID=UPI0006855BB6|nr:hypothetical protein [Paenibacillus pinihumi]
MAQIQHVIKAEIDLINPVQEICEIIQAVAAAKPQHEEAILAKIHEAVERRLQQLKGDESIGKPIRKPNTVKSNQ